jgi:hypothetical protein
VKSGHRSRAMNPSRASKRRRRLVRTDTFAPRARGIEHAVGARNLRKAVAAREGRHGHSSQTLQESRSPREERSRGNSRTPVAAEHLRAGCGQPHNREEGSSKRYDDTCDGKL